MNISKEYDILIDLIMCKMAAFFCYRKIPPRYIYLGKQEYYILINGNILYQRDVSKNYTVCGLFIICVFCESYIKLTHTKEWNVY